METELLPTIRGNVQLLRTIWNSRIEKDQPISSHLIHSQQRLTDYISFINAPKPTIITDDDDNNVEDTSNVLFSFCSFEYFDR